VKSFGLAISGPTVPRSHALCHYHVQFDDDVVTLSNLKSTHPEMGVFFIIFKMLPL
jgi:hypothetical protein